MKAKRMIMVALVAMVAMLSVVLSACQPSESGGGSEGETLSLKVVSPDGAPFASIVGMFEGEESTTLKSGDTEITLTSEIELESNLKSRMVNGSADIILTPTNVGAAVHKDFNAGDSVNDYKLAGVVSWGLLYMVTTDESLKTREESDDLESFLAQFTDKEIKTIGLTAIPGLATGKLFGTDNLVGVAAASEIVGDINLDNDVIGVLGEPIVTTLRSKSKVLCSITDIYQEKFDSKFPMASVFVKSSLAQSNEDEVNDILDAMDASAKLLNDSPEKAGEYAESMGSSAIKKATLPTAQPFLNADFVASSEAKADVVKFMGSLGLSALVPDSLFM